MMLNFLPIPLMFGLLVGNFPLDSAERRNTGANRFARINIIGIIIQVSL